MLPRIDRSPFVVGLGGPILKRLVAILAVSLAWPAAAARAQLAAPNSSGVSMGHLHYHVRDVEAHKKFWTTLGGTPMKLGTTDVIKFPDVEIFLTQGPASGGTEGSTVNHLGFKVPDLPAMLAKLKAAGYPVEGEPSTWGSRANTNIFTPDNDRVELFQQQTELARFDPDDAKDQVAGARLNQKMTVPISTHHVHLYSPAGTDAQVKAWYVKVFGAIPGKRGGHYEAADLPGINLNFCSSGCSHSPGVSVAVESAAVLAPSKGRTLDHIGFEIKNLEAFCKRLEASGVKLEIPYAKDRNGIASASFTDPWGTTIELTEGLNRL